VDLIDPASHRSRCLFVVEGTFTVCGRGIALLAGAPRYQDSIQIFNGMPIELRRPDGSTRATVIQAIEWFQTPPMPTSPIHLPPEVSKGDVPPGTEVWTGDSGELP
jgi:hypothetical protein